MVILLSLRGGEWFTKGISIVNGSDVTNAYITLIGYNYSTLLTSSSTFTNKIPNFNSTTNYNGSWEVSSGVLLNPELTGDFKDDTRTTLNQSTNATYYADFTTFGIVYDSINYTVKSRTSNSVMTSCNIYCQNKSSGSWVKIGTPSMVSILSTFDINVSKSCFDNSSAVFNGTDFSNTILYTKMECIAGGNQNELIYVYDVYLSKGIYYNFTQNYPTNVTLIFNNDTTVFNYGNTNGSNLDHAVTANITSFFNTSITYPLSLNFRSNTTGIVGYSGFSLTYTYYVPFSVNDTAIPVCSSAVVGVLPALGLLALIPLIIIIVIAFAKLKGDGMGSMEGLFDLSHPAPIIVGVVVIIGAIIVIVSLARICT